MDFSQLDLVLSRIVVAKVSMWRGKSTPLFGVSETLPYISQTLHSLKSVVVLMQNDVSMHQTMP